jgi:two-component system, LuxR family, sensor kinase FixL
MDEDVAAAIA